MREPSGQDGEENGRFRYNRKTRVYKIRWYRGIFALYMSKGLFLCKKKKKIRELKCCGPERMPV